MELFSIAPKFPVKTFGAIKLDFKSANSLTEYIKIRSNQFQHHITHIVVTTDFWHGFKQEAQKESVETAKCCRKLEKLEAMKLSWILKDKKFQGMVNAISSQCKLLNQIVCLEYYYNLQTDWLIERIEAFFKACKTINRITIRTYDNQHKLIYKLLHKLGNRKAN